MRVLVSQRGKIGLKLTDWRIVIHASQRQPGMITGVILQIEATAAGGQRFYASVQL